MQNTKAPVGNEFFKGEAGFCCNGVVCLFGLLVFFWLPLSEFWAVITDSDGVARIPSVEPSNWTEYFPVECSRVRTDHLVWSKSHNRGHFLQYVDKCDVGQCLHPPCCTVLYCIAVNWIVGYQVLVCDGSLVMDGWRRLQLLTSYSQVPLCCIFVTKKRS